MILLQLTENFQLALIRNVPKSYVVYATKYTFDVKKFTKSARKKSDGENLLIILVCTQIMTGSRAFVSLLSNSNTQLASELLQLHDLPHIAIAHAFGDWSTYSKSHPHEYRVDAFLSDRDIEKFLTSYMESLEDSKSLLIQRDRLRNYATLTDHLFTPDYEVRTRKLSNFEFTPVSINDEQMNQTRNLISTALIDDIIVSVPGSDSLGGSAQKWVNLLMKSKLLDQSLFWLLVDVGQRSINSFTESFKNMVLNHANSTSIERNINMAFLSLLPMKSEQDCQQIIDEQGFLGSLLGSLDDCEFAQYP
ncbi:hypothetical protein Ciccas_011079, partial [Cichlidogyrus casuarinus]